MIKFKSLSYKNFLSVGNEPICIDIENAGTTIITGKNGVGKSTMLDALSFSLFGKAQRKINKSQLINSVNEKECIVECEFSVVPGNDYKVVRGIKPNIFEIYENGKIINQESHSRDYQAILENTILKMNHNSFYQIVVLASSNYIPFMELPAYSRRAVVENLLGVEVFAKMHAIIKERLSSTNTQRYLCEQNIKTHEHSIFLLKEHKQQLENIQKADRKKVEDALKSLLKEKQALSDSLSELIKNKLKSEISAEYYSECQRKISERTGEIYGIKTTVTDKGKSIRFFEKKDVCPTCGQTISEKLKQEKIKKLQNEIVEAEGLAKSISQDVDNLKRLVILKYETWLTYSNEHGLKVATANAQIRSIEQQIEKTESEIQKMSEGGDSKEIIKSSERIAEECNTLKTAKKHLKTIDTVRRHLEVLYDAFKDEGIKAKIIRQYLPIINKYINMYLSELDFFASFSLNENFDETIRASHRDDFSYFSFSEGEKVKINLAVLFAWREISKYRNSVHTNLLLMDEVGDSSLDAEALDTMLSILKKHEHTNTLLISHRVNVADAIFDHHLEISKDSSSGGFTYMKKVF